MSLRGKQIFYEVLQKILLNYNRKESLLIKMQDKLTAFRSSETGHDFGGHGIIRVILLREDYKPLVWNGFGWGR